MSNISRRSPLLLQMSSVLVSNQDYVGHWTCLLSDPKPATNHAEPIPQFRSEL